MSATPHLAPAPRLHRLSDAPIEGKRVLVPLDLSNRSFEILQMALDTPDSEVHAIHVIDEPKSDAAFIRHALDQSSEASRARSVLRDRLASLGVENVGQTVTCGHPATEIAKAADRLVCEAAQGFGHLVDRPGAGKIGQGHNQGYLLLSPAQLGLDRRFLGLILQFRFESIERFL